MLPGDIVGHEMMGEVVDVGTEVIGHLTKGDRIVVPFIGDECDQCKRRNFSVCERTNRKKQIADKGFGNATAGLLGYVSGTLGMRGKESLIRAYGIRKIGSGIL